MSKRFVFLLLAALSIRLLWIASIPLGGARLYPFFDADGYLEASEAFQKGAFLDDGTQIKRMPLYPALTAFFPHWFTNQPLTIHNPAAVAVIRLWHAALDTCTAAFLYLFVLRRLGDRTALVAGWLYAVYPLAWYRIPVMNTEIIQGTAVAFWLMGAVRALETRHTKEAVLLSLLSTVLAFISPALQFIPLLFSLYLFLSLQGKEAFRLSAALLIPFFAISVGWGLRNYAATGEFYLYDTRGGKEFWLGNNQEVDGRWEGPQQETWLKQWRGYIEQVRQQGGGERAINKFLYRKGVEQILANPVGAGVLCCKKFFRFWCVPASESMLSLTIPLQTLYLVLAVIGWFALGDRRRDFLLPLSIVGYYCAIYTLSYACIRFSLPVMPWICALAGAGASRFWSGRKETAA